MDKLSPFQIVLIAVFGIAALLGLYVFATFSGGPQKGAIGAVSIWGTLPEDAVRAGINELAQGNEEYSKISYTEIPADSFSLTLANALASGSGPDLLIISQEQLLAERGKLQPIPYSVISERDFVDSYLPIFELFLSGEGIYGIPLAVDPLVLYYNRSILASAGLVGAPATWEGVAGLAPSITLRDSQAVVSRSMIGFGGYDNIQNARAILSLLFFQAGSSITADTDSGVESVLDAGNEVSVAPAESAVNFYTEFADPAKTVYSWNSVLPNSSQMFLTGDLVLYPGFASELRYLLAANPNLDFDITSMPQPAIATNRQTYGLGYVFAIPRVAVNRDGGLNAAFALAEPATASIIVNELGMVPALRSLATNPGDDRYRTVYYPEALVAKGWLSPAPEVTDSIFSAMIANITTGRVRTHQALQSADESLDAAIR